MSADRPSNGRLVADASGRLAATAAQLEQHGVPMVALGAIAPRFCRAAVVDAAHLSNDRLVRAIAAAEAADATREDAVIKTAYEHYDFALAETIDENGLAPVVLALADLLFERQAGEANG